MSNEKGKLILVDDDKFFSDVVVEAFKIHGMAVTQFFSAAEILDNIVQYPKDIKICLDHNLGFGMDGLELAAKLHSLGYHKLYLLSGTDFTAEEVPEYLQVILKIDINKLYSLIDD